MPTHKSNDYKLTAVQYYLVEDKTQEDQVLNIIMAKLQKKIINQLLIQCIK